VASKRKPASGSRPDRGKRALRVVVTVLVVGGGIGVVATLRHIDWAMLGSALAHVSLLLLGLSLAVSTLQVFTQLARFFVVVPREDRAPLRELLEATAVGQLLNYTMALRAGDAYRLARLSGAGEHAKGRVGRLAAALLLERVADVLALLVITACAVGSLGAPLRITASPTRETAVRVAFAVALGGLAVSLLIGPSRRVVLRAARQTWQAVSSPRFARCVVVSLVAWFLDAGTLYWTARSAGSAIPFRVAMPCIFVLNVGIAVPVTVGNIGVFEASLGFALAQYGVAPERALVIASLEHIAKVAGLVVCVGLLKLAPRGARPGAA